MKQIITLLIILIFNISCSQETKEETFDIEKIKLTEKEKVELNNVFKYYKNFTIKEIKADFKESFENFPSNEKETVFDKDSVLKEEYGLPFRLHLGGIKKQVEVLKNKTFLIQNFKNDSVYIRFDTENRYYTHHHNDESVFNETYSLKAKFLSTKEIDTSFNKKKSIFSFGYYNINFGKAKYIDSLLITANINYTKSYDTIVFSKKEILKNKEGIIIKNISNNYIHFENNKNVKFFKLEAYNSNGRKLKKKTSRSYSPNTIRKYNKELLKILEKAYQNIKNIDNHQKIKEEIKKINYKIILLNRKHNGSQYSFHGNIDKIKFYIEKERDSLDFDFVARNKFPSTYYLNELEKETLVMSTKNELLFTIPDTNFEYLKYDSFNKRNTFYLYNKDEEQHYYLNTKKQILRKVVHIEALSENLVKAELEEEDNYFYAIFNSNKENVSGFKYLDIVVEKYNEEFYIIAQKKDKTYTFINNKGEEIGTKGLTNIRTFWFKYAPIVSAIKNNKIGFVDKNGETKVPFIYDIYNKQFSDLEIKKNNLFGLMGLNGKLSIPLIYNKLERFYNNLYIVTKNGYQGIVDINNKIILPIKYKIWKNDLENLHVISCNSKAGYINKKGKIIIPEIYKKDGSDNFSHGFAQVCRTEDNKCAIINEKNEVIIPWTDATINYKYHEGKRTYTIGSKTYNYLLQLIE